MTQLALISFEGADIGYGKTKVLRGVDLKVHSKDFWGILGFNGSGKSTLLKTILGLIPCVRGSVKMDRRLRFGYVPQKERLDPIYPLSAHAVTALGSYHKFSFGFGTSAKEQEKLIYQSLKEAGAEHLAAARYSELSGGQRQRVLIARALASEPNILVLDEPLAGIDIKTQESILHLLRKLKQEKSLTVLMVSHRIQAEKDLFTHIAWVDEGRVEAGAASQMISSGKVGQVFKSEL